MTKNEKQTLSEAANIIERELLDHGEVKIHRFGKFTVSDMDARNPLTWEKIPTKRVGFKPSTVLKNTIKSRA